MNNTLLKGLALLEALARTDGTLGVTAIAERLGLAKSNVHRLLQGLVDLGYAVREEGGGYRASIGLWRLAAASLDHLPVLRAAAPVLRALADETREAAHLSMPAGDAVVAVFRTDAATTTPSPCEADDGVPAHATAVGKALLAHLDEPILEARAGRLARCTGRTIVLQDEFLREMQHVRRDGFALARGEWRDDVCGVAAPVRDADDRIVAAVGVSGRIDRFRPARARALGPRLVETASSLHAAMVRERRGGTTAEPPESEPVG